MRWIVEVDWTKAGIWGDEGARVVSIQTNRGRDRMLSESGPEPMRAGECVITLDNWDGRYDPFNSGGALYGYLLPGRPFRLSVEEEEITYPVIAGFLTDIRPLGRGQSLAILRGADGLYFLDMQDCELVTPASDYAVSSAINDLLEMSDWPLLSSAQTFPFTFPLTLGNTAIENNGDEIPNWTTDTGKSILDTMNEIAEAFLGTIFTTREGSLTYATRDTLRTTKADIDEAELLVDIETNMPWDEVYNDIRVTPTTGAVQTASDSNSQSIFGRRTLVIDNNQYIQSATQALQIANWIELWAPEIKRGFRVRLESRFALQYGLELMDRVAVTADTLGVNGLYSVGKIEHAWQAGRGGITRLWLEPDIYDIAGMQQYFPFTFPLVLSW